MLFGHLRKKFGNIGVKDCVHMEESSVAYQPGNATALAVVGGWQYVLRAGWEAGCHDILRLCPCCKVLLWWIEARKMMKDIPFELFISISVKMYQIFVVLRFLSIYIF